MREPCPFTIQPRFGFVPYKLIPLVLIFILLACRFGTPQPREPTATLPPQPTAPPQTAGATTPTEPALQTATPTASEQALEPLQYTSGINEYTIVVDNTPRQFLVYVPRGYNPVAPTPVVFMFHGSNQSGLVMYQNTAWAAKAEEENFIVVYPTSWKYFIVESNRVEDKWNVVALSKFVKPGTELKDDVKFVRTIIDALTITFNIDPKRLYASGFSNGGAFVLSRLLIGMNDVFAAFTTSGSLLTGENLPEPMPTGITAPLYAVLGTNDEKIAEGRGYPTPFPILAEEIAQHPLFHAAITNTTTILALDPSVYEVEYDRPHFTIMTFDKSLIGAENQFIFRMVNRMGHVYGNGENNNAGLNLSDVFWEFFMRYSKP